MPSIHYYKVEMTCGGCSGAVERVLGKLGDKIEKLNIDLDQRLVTVSTEMTSEEILQVIKKTGKQTSYIKTEMA